MKRRLFSALIALVMVLSLLPFMALAADFNDTAGHWGAGAINRWTGYDVIGGYGDGTFLPDKTMSRAEAAQIFVNLLKLTQTAAISGYTDVPAGAWYADPISKCVAAGVLTGTGDGAMSPDANLSREQMFTMLARSLGVRPEASGANFTDSDQIQSWAVGYINALYNMGVLQGVGDGSLAPGDEINRASVMAAMDRAIGSYITASGAYSAPSSGIILIVGGSDVSVTGDISGKYITVCSSGAAVDLSGATGAATITVTNSTRNVSITGAAKGTAVAAPSGSGITVNGEAVSRGSYVVGSGNIVGGGGGSGSSGSGGSGGGSRDTRITGVTIAANSGSVELQPGDILTVASTPADATYTVQWYVGSSAVATINDSYTVAANDVGAAIYAVITGTGNYTGTATSNTLRVSSTVAVNPKAASAKLSPVVVGSDTKYYKEDGTTEITPDEDAQFYLTVETRTVSASEVGEDQVEAVADVLTGIIGPDAEKDENYKEAELSYVRIDADLTMVTTDKETGETTTTEVHPVGATTLTLSGTVLGVPAGEDLNKYIFIVYHTDVTGEVVDTVEGTVISNNGVQYVSFSLKGLSPVWLGSVAPRTVTFDTKGGSAIPAQQVKYGWYAMDVEPPVRAGYLFTGWDKNLATTRIFADAKFTALDWVEGAAAAVSQLSGSWTSGASGPDSGKVNIATADGKVTLTLYTDVTYASGLAYTVTVKPVTGAVKYVTGTSANDAINADAKDAASVDTLPSLTANVTDSEGKILRSSASLYIKWLDEDDKPLVVQSVTLVVQTGDSSVIGGYDTVARTETHAVDRGLGKYTVYLADPKTTDGPTPEEYYADVHVGSVSHRWNSDSYTDEYYLPVTAATGIITGSIYSESEQRSIYTLDASCYKTVVTEITPFGTESFTKAPVVASAYCFVSGGSDSAESEIKVTAALEDGNAVLTFAVPEAGDGTQARVEMILTYGTKSQEFVIYLNYAQNEDETPEAPEYRNIYTESWSEAVNCVLEGYDSVRYTGSEAVLNQTLELKPGQSLYLSESDLTVGSGGKLILTSSNHYGSAVILNNGKITVAGGGTVAGAFEGSRNSSGVGIIHLNAVNGGILVENGGTIQSDGYLVLNGDTEIARGGGIVVGKEGSLMMSDGYENYDGLVFDLDLSGTLTIDTYGYFYTPGSMTVGQTGVVQCAGRMDTSSGLDLSGTLTIGADGDFYAYGGMTVGQTGAVRSAGHLIINSAMKNSGSIDVTGGRATFVNPGYTVYNYGTITLASNASLTVQGTVLLNTGRISGSGVLYLYEYEDSSSYYNGARSEDIYYQGIGVSNRTWQFAEDPDPTVDMIFYVPKLANSGSGACTVTVR